MSAETPYFNLPTRALVFASKAHADQRRKYTNDPYIVHPIQVAARVRNVLLIDGIHSFDVDLATAAAYMHDVLEDTAVTEAEMRAEFGDDVTNLVLEVTDVSKPEDGNRAKRKQIDRDHIAKASELGATIKLADMIDNTSTITAYDPDFAKVYMREKAMLLPVVQHGNRWLIREARELVEGYLERAA